MASEIKGLTPKGDQVCCPNYKANAKSLGTEAPVRNVSGNSAFQNEPSVGSPYKSLASPLKK